MRVMHWRMVLLISAAMVGLSGHTGAAELTIGSKAPAIDIEHWSQTRVGSVRCV